MEIKLSRFVWIKTPWCLFYILKKLTLKRKHIPWSQRFFLEISPHERAAREPRSSEKEKPLVTLDLNLTFMQTPAVKRVNLIIQNGTNGSLAITCLSAANVSTRVVRSGIFWPTWLGSMCVFARLFSSATIAKVNCLLDILRSKHLHFSFWKKASGLPNKKV